jgi:hypothetical protein
MASNLSTSSRNPRWGMIRDPQQVVAYQHERELPRGVSNVRLEEIEQLGAALVRVDAADVDGKRPANVELVPKPSWLGARRHVGSDPDDDRRHAPIVGKRLDHRPLFGRVVHERTNAFEDGFED